MTYVQDNNALVEVSIGSDGIISKNVILRVDTKNKIIEDAYLFDEVAAVKVKGYFFEFYKRPVVLNSFAVPILHSNTTTQAVGNPNITAWDFRVYEDGLQCFAVAGSNIYRYLFTFDVSNTIVTTQAFFVSFPSFNGNTYTVNATPKEIVISCSDCS